MIIIASESEWKKSCSGLLWSPILPSVMPSTMLKQTRPSTLLPLWYSPLISYVSNAPGNCNNRTESYFWFRNIDYINFNRNIYQKTRITLRLAEIQTPDGTTDSRKQPEEISYHRLYRENHIHKIFNLYFYLDGLAIVVTWLTHSYTLIANTLEQTNNYRNHRINNIVPAQTL